MGLILQAVQPAMCTTRQAIYFWRVTEDGKSSMMYKPIDPEMPARKYRPLNERAECVACHSVALEGEKIAAIADGSNGPILLHNLDGSPVNIPAIRGSYLSLSKDGRKLAYAFEGKDIYILDVESGVTIPLPGASDAEFVETMPAWAPDGKSLAFVRAMGEVKGYSLTVPCDIYTIPIEGGRPTLLPGAGGNGFNYYPAYSPDGRWLAFTRHTSGTSTRSDPQAEIYLVPAQGGPAKRLAANDLANGQKAGGISNSWPSWSPDSRSLAFNSKRSGDQFDIYITSIDPEGNSGTVRALADANRPDFFEHLPQWGYPPVYNLWAELWKLLPWLLFLPLPFLLCCYVCQRKKYSDTVGLARSRTPDKGSVGDEFQVKLDLTGLASDCQAAPVRKPVDVVLVVDVSGSMTEPASALVLGERKIDGARRSARVFAQTLSRVNDRLGIVVFTDQAEVTHPLSVVPPENEELIQDQVSGGTAIDQGLAAALKEVKERGRKGVRQCVILLSDGQSDLETARAQAQELKDWNVRLVTIAFGSDADEGMLKELASSPADAYRSTSNQNLEKIFCTIAETMVDPIPAARVIFVHHYNSQEFELDENSIRPRTATLDRAKASITWMLGDLRQGESRTLCYRTRAKTEGVQWYLDQGDIITYDRCGESDLPMEYFGEENKKGKDKNQYLPVLVDPILHIDPDPRKIPLTPPTPLELPVQQPVWLPDAALLIGVGEYGRQVLTHLKKNLRDAGKGTIPDRIQFLLVDTPREIAGVSPAFAGVSLAEEDVWTLDKNLTGVIDAMKDPNRYPELRPWFHPEDFIGGEDLRNLAKGTHGSRPLARAGFICALNQEKEKKKTTKASPTLLNRLKTRLEKVKPVGKTTTGWPYRVLLIGSLSDGMSGLLVDLAYLTKEVARNELKIQNITVNGYFDVQTENNINYGVNETELNAFAALRELTWFQLNPGFDYPMIYGGAALNKKLIDDLFVFFSQPGEHAMIGASPAAAVADLITLSLDCVGEHVQGQDWNADRQNLCQESEDAEHQVFFATAHGFTLRLPAYDLIEQVKLRWAKEFLEYFIMGALREKLDIQRDDIQEVGFIAVNELAHDFWNPGGRYFTDSPCPETLKALHSLDQNPLGDSKSNNERLDEAGFRNYLNGYLRLILMGVNAEQNPRAGKTAYAKAFLDLLKERLAEIDLQEHAQWSDTIRIAQEGIENKKKEIQACEDFLVKVWTALAGRANDYKKWQQEMDAVTSRKYLWEKYYNTDGTPLPADQRVKLVDQWYTEVYQTYPPQQYVQHLCWQTDQEQGEIRVVLAGQEAVTSETPERFVEGLLTWVGYFTQELWDGANLGKFERDMRDRLNEQPTPLDWERVKPYLLRENLIQPRGDQSPIRWKRASSDSIQAELTSLAQPIPDQGIGTLKLSDPLSVQWICRYDNLTLTWLTRVKPGPNNQANINKRYQEESVRRAVWGWEEEAKKLVQEFAQMAGANPTHEKMLNPLVAVGVEQTERAELYALAYALGWVKSDRGQWGCYPAGQLPALFTFNPPGNWAAEIYGLLSFVLEVDEKTVQDLQKILDQDVHAYQAGWLIFYNQRPTQCDEYLGYFKYWAANIAALRYRKLSGK
ncbi:MAG: VWA domain-containing protein [Bacteroidales bacterium]